MRIVITDSCVHGAWRLEPREDSRDAEERAEHDGGNERGGSNGDGTGAARALSVEGHVWVARRRGRREGVRLAGSSTSEVGTVGLCEEEQFS